jgi:hypothetical protein
MTQFPIIRKDLPFFAVESIEEGPVTAATVENTGFRTWYLTGSISDPAAIDLSRWCALLGEDRNCLYGNWIQEGRSDGKLIFGTSHDPKSITSGARLPFAGDIHAWTAILIEDGPSAWEERVFATSNAVQTRFVDADGKTLRGIKPAADSGELVPDAQIIKGGWDHEHCLLCNGHIDPGDRFFEHTADRGNFLCVACYDKHAKTGDLSFLLKVRQLEASR